MSDYNLVSSEHNDLIERLFDAFANPNDFPYEAIVEAKANWATVGEHFIEVLEEAAADPWDTIESAFMWHDFAFRLASDMRDTRAFRHLIAMLYLPDDAVEALLGDALTESVGRALAVTVDTTDPNSEMTLRAVAQNRRLHIWCRHAAVAAVCIRAHEGDADRDSVKAWLHALCVAEFETLLSDEEEEDIFLVLLVNDLVDFRAAEYLRDIEHWWEALGISFPNVPIEYIRDAIVKPYDQDNRFNQYCDDLSGEFADWAAFTEPAYRKQRAGTLSDQPIEHSYGSDNEYDYRNASPQLPFVRTAAKIGRNDPCTCNSGLKFKKCCGKNA